MDVERLSQIRTIDLTTFGRRSGLARRIEIWWFYFEERFVVTGTPGRRDWLANVIADPRVVVHALGMEFDGVASLIDDEGFRRRFFTRAETSWYSSQAQLDRLVATAPMIEVHLGGESPSV